MKEIVFIRHSKTLVNKSILSDLWTLSDEGVGLMRNFSQNQDLVGIDMIFTSFQLKALQTTSELAKILHVPIYPIKELTESTSITNGYFEDFENEIQKWHRGEYRINKGETKQETLDRINAAIDHIIKSFSDKTKIAIVSHGNVLAAFAEQFCDQDSYTLHKNMQMPDLAILDILNRKFVKSWMKN